MTRSKKEKAVSPKVKKLKEIEEGLINNGKAMTDHKKKHWSLHDLTAIKPLNAPQRSMIESYISGNNIVANGSAGTGKTLMALYLALNDVLDPKQPQDKIIIVRSAVATRQLGHLPGDLEEKLEPYERPYIDMVSFLMGHKPNSYQNMKEAGLIEFMPTSFIRGITWDDSVILVDEIQNMNFWELNSVITRVGDNANLMLVGDQIQTDLYKTGHDTSGMERFLKIAASMKEFDEILFTKEDIIRSDFVKAWIVALEEAG